MKYIKTYNEKLADKLLPPTDEEILSKIKDLSTEEIVKLSIDKNFIEGFKYVLDNRKNDLSDDDMYILEKYILGLHKDEEREYEAWFKEQLTGLEFFPSKNNSDIIIYKKDDVVLFNYYNKNLYFWIDYDKIWAFFKSKFKLNYYYITILTKYMVEEHLNLSVISTAARSYKTYPWMKE